MDMADTMSRVTIICKKEKFDELRVALLEIGIQGMTVTEVHGCGVQQGKVMQIRGVKKEVHLLPKIKIDIVVCTVPVEKVIETANKVLRTGQIGDGKIFVSEIKQVVRIRTNERDKDALRNPGEEE